MASRFQKKWAYMLLSGAFALSASQYAFAVETSDPGSAQPSAQQLPSSVLTAQQLGEYTADPGKLLTDFVSNPGGLAQAVTQLAVSGAAGATAATSSLEMATAGGNKSLVEAIAKGLGVAVTQLSNAGNLTLASAIQVSVASIANAAATGSPDIADTVNSSFATGRNATATAAIAGGGQGADGGSAGVGGGVVGASNGFRGGGDSSTTNSTGANLFGGTSSSSVPSPS